MDMPKVGDHLIVEHQEYGSPRRVEVEVAKTARYRFVVRVAGPAGSRLPSYYTDWDVRTGTSWGYKGNYAPRIATEQWWVVKDRETATWRELGRSYGLSSYSLKGDLKKAAEADPVRFAAVLEQFIISVNEESK